MTVERIAVISGYRSPMGKAGGALRDVCASDLGARILKESILRSKIDPKLINEVVIGNVAQPADSANIARIIALKADLPESIPAYTVHRNCASGMESFTTASSKIRSGESEIVVVGGVESMTNIPFMYGKKMTEFFVQLSRAKTVMQKLAILSKFRLHYLKPIIGIQQGLTDPISGLLMGCTAENVAREFSISREKQDEFALNSHSKAQIAQEKGIFAEEIIPVNNNQRNSEMINRDEGVRLNQKIEDLMKLRPYFERSTGTVTVGNSSQVTDGASFAILMKESKAKELGFDPLGYISEYAYQGLDPSVMGLGPVYSTTKLLQNSKYKMRDFDLVELNEAFAAQAIGCVEGFASKKFAQDNLDLSSAVGEIDPDKMNVNGGAIALGHPVGMTGSRIIIHLMRELKRRGKNLGLATLCIGGGQGGSVVVEVE